MDRQPFSQQTWLNGLLNNSLCHKHTNEWTNWELKMIYRVDVERSIVSYSF